MQIDLSVVLKVTGHYGYDYLRKTVDLDVVPNKDDVLFDGDLEMEIETRTIGLDNTVSLILETIRFPDEDEKAEYLETMKKLGWS